MRIIRNLAHPPRYQKDHSGRRVTKIYLEHSFEIFDVVKDKILDKVGEDTNERLGYPESN